MIFVLLGILVLVISFVVALITLMREQKSIESTTNTQGAGNDEPIKIDEKDTLVQPPSPQNIVDEKIKVVQELPQRQDQSVNYNDNGALSEEQKIAEIRQELARIAGEKVPVVKNDMKIEVAINPSITTNESSSEGSSVGDKLSGEIYPRGMSGGE